jgi:hypothetical protein
LKSIKLRERNNLGRVNVAVNALAKILIEVQMGAEVGLTTQNSNFMSLVHPTTTFMTILRQRLISIINVILTMFIVSWQIDYGRIGAYKKADPYCLPTKGWMNIYSLSEITWAEGVVTHTKSFAEEKDAEKFVADCPDKLITFHVVESHK